MPLFYSIPHKNSINPQKRPGLGIIAYSGSFYSFLLKEIKIVYDINNKIKKKDPTL